jgi:hypothetical protein
MLPAGSSSASATRIEVGTVSKSGFLVHIENAETNTASGFAKYKKSGGMTTKLAPCQATEPAKTKDGDDVSIEVEIKNGGEIRYQQPGVACRDPATKCSIFALAEKLKTTEVGNASQADGERPLGCKGNCEPDPPPIVMCISVNTVENCKRGCAMLRALGCGGW